MIKVKNQGKTKKDVVNYQFRDNLLLSLSC